jgi:hypothetical protein
MSSRGIAPYNWDVLTVDELLAYCDAIDQADEDERALIDWMVQAGLAAVREEDLEKPWGDRRLCPTAKGDRFFGVTREPSKR